MTLVKWRRPFESGLTKNQAVFNAAFPGLMEDFFNDAFFRKEQGSFMPAINVAEDVDKFHLELSAPGFDKGDFKIELDKGLLTVSGEHKVENESKEKNFTRKEFSYGSFQRSFTLPEGIQEEAIDAKYENGILKLTLPKKEKVAVPTVKSITVA